MEVENTAEVKTESPVVNETDDVKAKYEALLKEKEEIAKKASEAEKRNKEYEKARKAEELSKLSNEEQTKLAMEELKREREALEEERRNLKRSQNITFATKVIIANGLDERFVDYMGITYEDDDNVIANKVKAFKGLVEAQVKKNLQARQSVDRNIVGDSKTEDKNRLVYKRGRSQEELESIFFKR